jgi:uncharacterized protein YcaQ
MADRQNGVLRVQSAWTEPGYDPSYVATELAEELELAALWLDLPEIAVAPRGDLAPALEKVVSRR